MIPLVNPTQRSVFPILCNVVEKGVSLLQEDLNNGRWNAKYGEI